MSSANPQQASRRRMLVVGGICLAGWLGMRGLSALSTQDLTVSAAAPAKPAGPPASAAGQPSAQTLAAAAAGKSPAVAKMAPKGGAQPAAAAGEEPRSYRRVHLGDLAAFKLPDIPMADQPPQKTRSAVLGAMPESLRALDGQAVSLRGFMLPIDVNSDGKVRSFGLMPNQNSCCYGVAPAANGWVMVTLASGKSVKATMDVPVEVHGRLALVPEAMAGEVTGLYKLLAFRVVKPAD